MKGIAITVVVIAALGIIGFLLYPKQESMSPVPDIQISDTTSTPLPETNSKTSKYVEFSSGVLGSTAEKNRILFFYANWCSTCRPADKEFLEKTDKIPEGFVVIRVNYNDTETDKEEQELAKKYGITYQHTFVEIDRQGNAVQTWNGGGLDELISKIDK